MDFRGKDRGKRSWLWMALLLAFALPPIAARAQGVNPAAMPPPPPEESAPPAPPSYVPDSRPAGPIDPSAMPPEPPEDGPRKLTIPDGAAKVPEPAFDPLGAQKDVEVGQYYQKIGDVDAAIARYQDATTHQPGLAKPYLLLGECWEKKDDADKAVQSYRKYLSLYPNAPDRDKVQKRIEKLQSHPADSAGA